MHWHACPPEPLNWFAWRDPLLSLLLTPALLLPLAGAVSLLLAWWLQLSRLAGLALVVLAPLALSALYTSATTAWLSGWLLTQLPPAPPAPSASPVAVLVGRGPEVAAATTDLVAQLLRRGLARGSTFPVMNAPRPSGSSGWGCHPHWWRAIPVLAPPGRTPRSRPPGCVTTIPAPRCC